jgi:hypothetical protein
MQPQQLLEQQPTHVLCQLHPLSPPQHISQAIPQLASQPLLAEGPIVVPGWRYCRCARAVDAASAGASCRCSNCSCRYDGPPSTPTSKARQRCCSCSQQAGVVVINHLRSLHATAAAARMPARAAPTAMRAARATGEEPLLAVADGACLTAAGGGAGVAEVPLLAGGACFATAGGGADATEVLPIAGGDCLTAAGEAVGFGSSGSREVACWVPRVLHKAAQAAAGE